MNQTTTDVTAFVLLRVKTRSLRLIQQKGTNPGMHSNTKAFSGKGAHYLEFFFCLLKTLTHLAKFYFLSEILSHLVLFRCEAFLKIYKLFFIELTIIKLKVLIDINFHQQQSIDVF